MHVEDFKEIICNKLKMDMDWETEDFIEKLADHKQELSIDDLKGKLYDEDDDGMKLEEEK